MNTKTNPTAKTTANDAKFAAVKTRANRAYPIAASAIHPKLIRGDGRVNMSKVKELLQSHGQWEAGFHLKPLVTKYNAALALVDKKVPPAKTVAAKPAAKSIAKPAAKVTVSNAAMAGTKIVAASKTSVKAPEAKA